MATAPDMISTRPRAKPFVERWYFTGMAIVMLSSELDEHVELMDRVLVFREHQLSREIPRDLLSRQTLGAAFFGEREPDDDSR